MATITTYEIHELANLVPMANSKELKALILDIQMNSQQEPAIIWQGKIVDGRNRYKACLELGIELKIKNLDDKLTYEEVSKFVKSQNTRRNLTETQKIMSAVKSQKKFGGTNNEVSNNWGISERTFKNAKYIDVHYPELIELLYNDLSVKIFDPLKGYEISTKKVNTIARIIKTSSEENNISIDNTEEIDLSYSVDSLIKTEIGKQWFYNKKENLHFSDKQMICDYIELANLKFKLKD